MFQSMRSALPGGFFADRNSGSRSIGLPNVSLMLVDLMIDQPHGYLSDADWPPSISIPYICPRSREESCISTFEHALICSASEARYDLTSSIRKLLGTRRRGSCTGRRDQEAESTRASS
ncbi:MAG: hypothetical protein R3B68_09660 [Phycisphaerales bacterium]